MKFLSKLRGRERAPSLPPKPTFHQQSSPPPPPIEKHVPRRPRDEHLERPSHQELLTFLRADETISPSRRPSHVEVGGADLHLVAQPSTATPTEVARPWYPTQPLKTSASAANIPSSSRTPAMAIHSSYQVDSPLSFRVSSNPRCSDGSVEHLSPRDDSSALLASSTSSRSHSGSGSMLRGAGRRLLSIGHSDRNFSSSSSSSSAGMRKMYGVAQRGSTTSLSTAVTANASSPNVATFALAEERRGSAPDSGIGASAGSEKLADQLRMTLNRKRSMPAFGKSRRSRPATSSGASGYAPPPLPLSSPQMSTRGLGLISDSSETSAHAFREHSTSFGGSTHSAGFVGAWQSRGVTELDLGMGRSSADAPGELPSSPPAAVSRHDGGAGSISSTSRRKALPFQEQRSFHMPLRRHRPGTASGVSLSPTQPHPPRSPSHRFAEPLVVRLGPAPRGLANHDFGGRVDLVCAHVEEESAAKSPDGISRMATPGNLRSAATAPSAQTAKWAAEAADLRHTAMCKLESEVHEHILQQLASHSEAPQTLRSLNLVGVFVEARRRLALDPTASRYRIPDEVPTGGASVVAFGALDSSATLVNMPWLAASSTPSTASEASPCPDTPGLVTGDGTSSTDVPLLAPSSSGELGELPALKVSLSPAPRRRRRPQTAPEDGARRGASGGWSRTPGSFGAPQEIDVAEDLTPKGTLLGHSPTLAFGVLPPSAFSARGQGEERGSQSRRAGGGATRLASESLSGHGATAVSAPAAQISYLSDSTRASNDSCSTSATSESMLFGATGLGVALDGKAESSSVSVIPESSSEATLAVAL